MQGLELPNNFEEICGSFFWRRWKISWSVHSHWSQYNCKITIFLCLYKKKLCAIFIFYQLIDKHNTLIIGLHLITIIIMGFFGLGFEYPFLNEF